MRAKSILLALALTGICALSGARPAYKGMLTLTQPDGTTLQASMQGDEWGHLVLGQDGCALVQDGDGWWCYARFDVLGNRLSSGHHAGEEDVSAEVLAASRDIPYAQLNARSALRRQQTEQVRQRERQRRSASTRAGEEAEERHGLIILAQFPNLPFQYTREDLVQLINGDTPGSALSYFNKQWEGRFRFIFDISPIVTLPQNYQEYGQNDANGNDKNPAQMIVDACKAVDSEVDFSRYDNDGDGEIDNVFVFYAGPDEAEKASQDHIWSHQWYVKDGAGITCRLDGKLLNNYACTSELMRDNEGGFSDLASIGTFCHEYTHTFGIPDLYDPDEQAETFWVSLDLMDAGNQNNRGYTPPNYSAVERWFFSCVEDWGNDRFVPKPLTAGTVTLEPIDRNGTYYLLETDQDGEIFLFECRDEKGWDAYIGGSGLLVYHIDRSLNMVGSSTALDLWQGNILNSIETHQCADVIEPDAEARTSYQQARHSSEDWYPSVHALVPHAIWPFGGMETYSASTMPAFRSWSGEDAPVALTGITRNVDGSVTFTVIEDADGKAPAVKIDRQLVFQDASIIQWSAAAPSFNGHAVIRYGHADDTSLQEVEVAPYEPGKFAYIIEGLTPSTPYKVELCCVSGSGIPGKVNPNAAFTTRTAPRSGQYPYIYLKDVERNADGSFPAGAEIPLRVFHAPAAEGVTWLWDDVPVRPGGNGLFRLTRSGTLKAVVSYGEGNETILKTITVK
ncbi:MAG: M6 family metalloprotease domain-containing protein [Bacteroidales bacterium]|nr:M6 family metalloprotease domain-containing protein [Bacteroidales bacterium]